MGTRQSRQPGSYGNSVVTQLLTQTEGITRGRYIVKECSGTLNMILWQCRLV